MSGSLSVAGAGNAFLRLARAKKVTALVEHFDAALVQLGFEPHRQAVAMVATLRGLDQLSWFAHAKSADQRKPSPETQADVVAVYERRAIAAAHQELRLRDSAIEALRTLPRTISSSKAEYRLYLELADLGLLKLVDRTVRNNIAYYTAVAS